MSPSSEKDPFDFEIPPASNHVIKNENGVFKVYERKVSCSNGVSKVYERKVSCVSFNKEKSVSKKNENG